MGHRVGRRRHPMLAGADPPGHRLTVAERDVHDRQPPRDPARPAVGVHDLVDRRRLARAVRLLPPFDPSLPTERDFIEVFDGRPLINLSLMVDFMRSLGLPTRLVTDSIGGSDESGSGLHPDASCDGGRCSPGSAGRRPARCDSPTTAETTMTAENAGPTATFGEAVDRARRNYVATVHAMTALNTAASLPTSLLRRSVSSRSTRRATRPRRRGCSANSTACVRHFRLGSPPARDLSTRRRSRPRRWRGVGTVAGRPRTPGDLRVRSGPSPVRRGPCTGAREPALGP
jgi:hypothetical protein